MISQAPWPDLPGRLAEELLRLPLAGGAENEVDAMVARLCAEHPAHVAAIRAFAAGPAADAIPLPRTRVGRYAVEGIVGEGGQAVILRGHDTSALDRIVVIKALRPGLRWSPRAIERLRREARISGSLQHEGICPVLDVVEEEGEVFVVMPLIDGEDLRAVLSRVADRGGGAADLWAELGRLEHRDAAVDRDDQGSVRAVVRLVQRLAVAVQCAHAAGVVHRDLKPGNIMIRCDGVPLVHDFGLAFDERSSSEGRVTMSGDLLGTPSYMAPEQVSGAGPVLGPHTDVYALGVMLYELLTTRLPFRGADTHETFARIRKGYPPPPAALGVRVPKDLEHVCLQAMHVDPARRYASAGEFADDLGRVLRLEPTVARPITFVERAWRRLRSRAGAAAALLVVAVFAWMWQSAEARVRESDRKLRAVRGADRDLPVEAVVAAHRHFLGRDPTAEEKLAHTELVHAEGLDALTMELLTAAQYAAIHAPDGRAASLAATLERCYWFGGTDSRRIPSVTREIELYGWQTVAKSRIAWHAKVHGANALPGPTVVYRWPRFPMVNASLVNLGATRRVTTTVALSDSGRLAGNVVFENDHLFLHFSARVVVVMLGERENEVAEHEIARCSLRGKYWGHARKLGVYVAEQVTPEAMSLVRRIEIRTVSVPR